MSSLIFCTNKDEALVVTDTLAVHMDGSPKFFTSKAHFLPHLRTIVAGTGVGAFSGDWFMHINSWMALRGVEDLDKHTSGALSCAWGELLKNQPSIDGLTTTVYHFGFSEETGDMVSFAYRSTNNFKSERLQYGMGVKPPCAIAEDGEEGIPEIMMKQRVEQEMQPYSTRLHIGGEATSIRLGRDGCWYETLFAFPDFHEQRRKIFEA